MSLVGSPPRLSELRSSSRLEEVLRVAQSKETNELIRAVNDRYLHWDKFKYHKIPSDFTHEDLWFYLKILRSGNLKEVPLKDRENQPFRYWIPDGIFRGLTEIDRLLGAEFVVGDQPGMPPREKYIIKSLMEEAIASSQIEGAATSVEVAKEMLRTQRKPTNKHEQMIMNNWLLMRFIRENYKQELTLPLLFQIHRMITDKTLDPVEAGRFREKDNIVVRYNDEVVHRPPLAKHLPERMKTFLEFANKDDDAHWVHPIVKAAVLHFWLAYDHPFTDGNGRTARGLLFWYLLNRGYSLIQYISISKYIVRAPSRYVRTYLYTETDDNDLTYFIHFNVRQIRKAVEDLRRYILIQQQEVAKSAKLLREYRGLNLRQRNLMFHAIQHHDTVYTIQAHRNTNGIAYDTARKDLLELARLGLLVQEKRGKEFVFVSSDRIVEKLRKKEAALEL